jgi:hypothetical protein
MRGYPLESFSGELTKETPSKYVFPTSMLQKLQELPGIKGTFAEEELKSKNWHTIVSRLPHKAFHTCTFEEIIRAQFGPWHVFGEQAEREFENDVNYRFANKIRCSLFKWGERSSDRTWNHLVEAYEAIRSFRIDDKDFSVTIDWAKRQNELGKSESGIFLDGAFAFLFHYKGEHVITVGFSVIGNSRLLIHQIQLAKKKGNRFLYKLDKPYIEWILSRMCTGFPGMKILFVDGESVARNIFWQYTYIANHERREFSRQRRFEYQCTTKEKREELLSTLREHYISYRTWWHKALEFRDTIMPRLRKLYEPTGVPFGKSVQVKGFTFRSIVRTRLLA